MAQNIEKTCTCSDDATAECSNAQFAELDEFISLYKNISGNLIIILQKAQALYGYLSRETIAHISRLTGHTQARIYGVATFYAQFRLAPIGKNLILLCQGTACHVSGSELIEKAITEELNIKDGETTEDGFFTLNNVACLGCCSLAPVMMIQGEHGEETYGNLTKESVIEILRDVRIEQSLEAEAI